MMKEAEILTDDPLWYKDAIIYELHIKAFNDSSGDGIGDFKGLLEKLDYLQELGITAIWLLPFYPSPLRDDGYDIADYYSINSSYGNIQDFKRLMKEAHKRGLRVITELVLNHTSDQHPWFQRARNAKKGSNHRNYYVWSDDTGKYKEVRIIFTDYEVSNWAWDPVANSYYWHRFFSHQPDLNFDNPNVQKEIFRILDYWMNLGVDGFRLDAVPYLYERENTNGENLPETHEFLKTLRSHVDKNHKHCVLLAEANMWPEDASSYFGNGDECHMNYHFPIMPRLFMSVKMEDRYPITDIFDQTPVIPDNCQWAMFLRNHDELTLEMVTDEERDYMYRVYIKDQKAKINLGIRHRLAPLLDNNRRKIELMNVLLFSLPGTPVIYYGDEIGMGDNFYLGDRDGVRTPMQWSADRNAGFSKANPQRLYLPVIIDPEYSYEAVNVETQQKNPSSLLWWMKRVINMRKRYKPFGRGDIKFLTPDNSKILAFTRTYQDDIILVIVNLSRFSQAAEINLSEYQGYSPVEVFSHNKFPLIRKDPYLFTVGPHGYYWFLLKPELAGVEISGENIPKLNVDKKEILTEKNLAKLSSDILPDYLKKCRWFGGKGRNVQKMNVAYSIPLSNEDERYHWLILEILYFEGLPEYYQLPLSFLSGRDEKEMREKYPVAAIASVSINNKSFTLVDAVYDKKFRNHLLQLFINKKKIKSSFGELSFFANKKFHSNKIRSKNNSRLLSAEQSNTSIVFDNKYFLKLYRKIDKAINPDAEIIKFLSEKTNFQNVPQFLGEIELNSDGNPSMIIGMLQELVPNQGDAWTTVKDSVARYYERAIAYNDYEKYQLPHDIFTNPLSYPQFDAHLQDLIGGINAERIKLLGIRTAEMHLALASREDIKDFAKENYSLHYQRSLFSSLQALVRTAFTSLDKNLKSLSPSMQKSGRELINKKTEILDRFKKIYSRKIDAVKIRSHGDFHLGQVLFTGKDFVMIDFEGEPARTFGERRLKKSSLRDIAGMVRSFHYAAYGELMQNKHLAGEELLKMEQWAELWYRYSTSVYLSAYYEVMEGSGIIPDKKEDVKLLIETFLLEKAVYELNYEINNRPGWVSIPIKGIKDILES
jgi:maltose alpha-D-glucosyltransferase / alpha-amylase